MLNLLDSLSLQQLRTLDTLLEVGSVTAAAKRMGVSQSALSHTLRGLRENLGDPLFVRGGSGVIPTTRAAAMKLPLRRALHDLQAVLTPAHFNPTTAQRRFVLGTPDAVAMLLVGPLLQGLRKEAPGIDIDVRPPGLLAESLESGSLDLGVDINPPDALGIRQRALYRDGFVCLVWSEHAVLQDGLDLDAYCRLPHVLVSPTGIGRSVVDGVLSKLGRTRRVAARVRYFLVAPTLLVGTDLILTLPRRVASAMVVSAPLIMIEPPLPLPGFTVCAVWHSRVDADPGHRWLRQQFYGLDRLTE